MADPEKIGDSGTTDAEALRDKAGGKANTPTMGGLLIVGSILTSVLLLANLEVSYVKYGIVVVVWLAALGGIDDWLKLTAKSRGSGSRQGLRAWEKLVFQLGLGLIIAWFVYDKGLVPGTSTSATSEPAVPENVCRTPRSSTKHHIYFRGGSFIWSARVGENAANITTHGGLAAGIAPPSRWAGGAR